jgi:hypothetical protein
MSGAGGIPRPQAREEVKSPQNPVPASPVETAAGAVVQAPARALFIAPFGCDACALRAVTGVVVVTGEPFAVCRSCGADFDALEAA